MPKVGELAHAAHLTVPGVIFNRAPPSSTDDSAIKVGPHPPRAEGAELELAGDAAGQSDLPGAEIRVEAAASKLPTGIWPLI